ncbi:MAG: hypothetical protein AAB581_00600 [Patescibacteria group bacterium]
MVRGAQKEKDGIGKDGPYCQIAKNRISAKHCGKIQGQEGCFGCAAPTRRCESCEEHMVEIPEVGMCTQCCKRELAQEEREEKKRKEPLEDPCKLCMKRPRRFKRSRLCLRCHHERYAAGDFSMSLPADVRKKPFPQKRGRKKREFDLVTAIAEAEQGILSGGITTVTQLYRRLRQPKDKKYWELVLRKFQKKGLAQEPKSRGGRWKLLVPEQFQKQKKKRGNRVPMPSTTVALTSRLLWMTRNFFESGGAPVAILQEAVRELKKFRHMKKVLARQMREWDKKGFLTDKKQKGV